MLRTACIEAKWYRPLPSALWAATFPKGEGLLPETAIYLTNRQQKSVPSRTQKNHKIEMTLDYCTL